MHGARQRHRDGGALAHVYTLRDGEFVRLQAFRSTEEARAALAYPEPR